MLPNTQVVINNNLEFCEYLASAQAYANYDCSNVRNDEPFTLRTAFISPAGIDMTLKNINLSLASPEAYFETIGRLILSNVSMISEKGCYILVSRSLNTEISSNLGQEQTESDEESSINEGATSNILTITSGSFITTDTENPSPICYRPTIVDSMAKNIPTEPELSRLFSSIIPETSSFFSTSDSESRKEVTEITELVNGLATVKGYSNNGFALNSSTLIVDELGRGEEPEIPVEAIENIPDSKPEINVPKAPNTGIVGRKTTLKFLIASARKIFSELTETILTRYI